VFPFEGGFWYVDLAAPAGSQLIPGAYEGAVRWPFMGAGQPGVSVTGDGRGCNTVTGRFDVLDVAFGPNGYIERLHARFEQHCEGLAPALRGELLVVNPPPPPALEIQLSLNDNARVERLSGKATISGHIRCTVTTTANATLVLGQRLTRSSLATGSAYVSLPCSPTARSWSVEVSPVGDVPFGNGFAQVDASVSGYDQYYGNFVNVTTGGAIKLGPR
jgi:hypothetical protein